MKNSLININNAILVYYKAKKNVSREELGFLHSVQNIKWCKEKIPMGRINYGASELKNKGEMPTKNQNDFQIQINMQQFCQNSSCKMLKDFSNSLLSISQEKIMK